MINDVIRDMSQLRAENESLRRDADRYRWLRQQFVAWNEMGSKDKWVRADTMDAAIDAALRERS